MTTDSIHDRPGLGGTHTLRNVKADIRRELAEHHLQLEAKIEGSARLAEETAVRRAEELLAPRIQTNRAQLEEELPRFNARMQQVLVGCQKDCEQHTRTVANTWAEALKAETEGIHEEVTQLRNLIHKNAVTVQELAEAQPVMKRSIEDLAADVRRRDEEAHRAIARMVTETSETVEQRWSRRLCEEIKTCQRAIARMVTETSETFEQRWSRRLCEEIKTCQEVSREVGARSRQQHADTISAISLAEDSLVARMEQLKLHMREEATKFAAEAGERCKAEIVGMRIEENVEQRLNGLQMSSDARLEVYESNLRAEIAANVKEVRGANEAWTEAKVTQLAEHLGEAIESMRAEAADKANSLRDTAKDLQFQIKDANKQLEAHSDVTAMAHANIRERLDGHDADISGPGGLRQELSSFWSGEGFQALRADVEARATRIELGDTAAALQRLCDEGNQRINDMHATIEGQRQWLDKSSRDWLKRCQGAEADAAEAKMRAEREASSLGEELRVVRAASTSMLHGVLRVTQVLGLLRNEPDARTLQAHEGQGLHARTRRGPDIGELLVWEQAGRSLSNRLQQEWRVYEESGAPSILAMLERKATHMDLHTVKLALKDPPLFKGEAKHPLWSPTSTAAPGDTRGTALGPLGDTQQLTLPELGFAGDSSPASARATGNTPLAPLAGTGTVRRPMR